MNINMIAIIISIITIITSIIFVGTRQNKSQLNYAYIALMLCALLWSVGAIGEVNTQDIYYFDPIIQTINYFSIGLSTIIILLIGIIFKNTKIKFTWKYWLLFILPIFSAISIASNESHHLFQTVFSITVQGRVMGPLMWVHYIYCYICIAIGMCLLIKQTINNSWLVSKQATTLIIGFGIPVIHNVLISFGVIPGGCYSSVPTFVILFLAIGIATAKYDMFDILPIALQTIVDHISDGFIVINEYKKIVDYNKTMQLWFGEEYKIRRNVDIKEFLDSMPIDMGTDKLLRYVKMSIEKHDSMSYDMSVNRSDGVRYYNIEITPIFDKNKYKGTILLCRDTTKYIESLETIKEYQFLLENDLEKVTRDKQELLIKSAIMEKIANTDALTDMYNHKTFQEYFNILIKQALDNNGSLQLAIIDIDDFKTVNDTFGHVTGDIILKRVAYKIKSMVTSDDIAARYGGEEFAVILTNKDLVQSLLLLENIRKEIENETHLELDKNITVSIGLKDYKGESKEEMFSKTDKALYKAKHSGKNRIVISNN